MFFSFRLPALKQWANRGTLRDRGLQSWINHLPFVWLYFLINKIERLKFTCLHYHHLEMSVSQLNLNLHSLSTRKNCLFFIMSITLKFYCLFYLLLNIWLITSSLKICRTSNRMNECIYTSLYHYEKPETASQLLKFKSLYLIAYIIWIPAQQCMLFLWEKSLLMKIILFPCVRIWCPLATNVSLYNRLKCPHSLI